MAANTWTPSLFDVTHQWCKAVPQAEREVMAFFPYVTSVQMINKIPDHVPLLLYTVFSIDNFASGASSFQVLNKIFKRPNTRVYHLEGLHAKLVFVDGMLISLGSQNLTARGAKNLEASVVTKHSLDTRQRTRLKHWQAEAVLLTQKMMEEMQKFLPQTQKHYQAYQEKIAAAEDAVSKAIAQYTQERMLKESKIVAWREKHQQNISNLKNHLSECADEIDWSEAEDLCFACAEIGGRKKNGKKQYYQAKNFDTTLFELPEIGWCWNNSGEYDTNKFSVSVAHSTMIRHLRIFLKNSWWTEYSLEAVRNWVLDAIGENSVFNYINEPFKHYGEGLKQSQNYYTFGKDRFAIGDFVKYYFNKFNFYQIYQDWEALQQLNQGTERQADAS